MKIRDILLQKGHAVVTMSEDRSVLDAVMTLVEHNIGSVVVVTGDRPVGILTERDILRITAVGPGQLESMKVSAVMTRDLISGTPEHGLVDVMEIMTSNRVRHLPVVDDGQLVGIVSIGDVVNACRLIAEEENVRLREYIQGT